MRLFAELPEGAVVPPQSLEAEQAVLGAMLLEPEAPEHVRGRLAEGDFYREHHRTIYRAMERVAQRREPIDLITVSSELRREGVLDDVGGGEYLTALIGEVPTTAHVGAYAKRVWENSQLRRAIEQGMDLARDGYGDHEDVRAFLAERAQALSALAEATFGDGGGPVHMADLGEAGQDELTAYIEELASAESRPCFGLPKLDDELGGMAWGSLVALLGFPGFGKTTLVCQAAYTEAVVRCRGAAIYCGEQPRKELLGKLVDIHTAGIVNVSPWAARHDRHELTRGAREALADILQANLAIQGSERRLRYEDVTASIRRLRRTRSTRFFVVDSFSNLATGEREDVRELKAYANGFRALAGELDCTILATSQVTLDKRSGETSSQWCVELENQAHIVARLVGAQPGTVEEQRADPEVDIIVRKVRIGRASGKRFRVYREAGRLVERATQAQGTPPPAPRRKEREDARYGV
jgi:replicative DNA helicase